MTDLKAFTRYLVTLSARWRAISAPGWTGLAIAHWNHPHVHLVVRGVADDGSDLVIPARVHQPGLRSRAADLVSAELRPQARA